MRRAIVLTARAVALCASALSATTVLYVPIDRSIELSEAVLVGHVLRMESAYNANGEIVTRIDLLIEESLKGNARSGDIVTFEAWGGSLDGVNVETVGEARYRLGQKVLVQLESVNGELHTLGLSFGKWDVTKDAKGQQWISRSLSDLNVVGITEAPVEKMPLRQMREIARERPAF
jgi:hypothetical protein